MKRALIVSLLVVFAAAPAGAQDDGPALRPHRFTVAGGVTLFGGYDIGTSSAALRRNETGGSPGAFPLFSADGALTRASGVEARLGYALTRTIALEFGASYSRPTVAVDISGDSEAGGSVRLADQHLLQYLIDVTALWQITRLKLGDRARPYVLAGGGYLRQLDVDRVKAETGKIVQLGAGVRYWLRGGDAQRRALGLRLEARAQARSGGVDFQDKTRLSPAANLFLFFGF